MAVATRRSTDLIAGYVLDMQRRNLSNKTQNCFRGALDKFASLVPLEEAATEDIHRFIDTAGGPDGLSARSRSWYISAFHGFYDWAVSTGNLPTDPTRLIRTPKVARRLPRPIPDVELAEAIHSAEPQMRAMLLLGALAGMRCMEIAGLRSEDVDLEGGHMRVIGKGDKERVLPIHPAIRTALEALPMPARGTVIRGEHGRSLTADRVSHLVSRYLHSSGSESGAHALRHFFGTKLYGDTLDLRLTQELMGHASPATTAVYAAANMAKASAAVSALTIGGPQHHSHCADR
jgi:site-specific recombinase XerD